jgi:amino acid transporter
MTLPLIGDGFPGWGNGTSDRDFAINAVMLGTALIVFTAVVNSYGVNLKARINSARVFIELIAAMLLVVALVMNLVNPCGPV